MKFATVNPATGNIIRDWELMPDAEIDRLLVAARSASHDWRKLDVTTRAALLKKLGELLLKKRDACAELMATEMGKPITQGRNEIEKCVWGINYYADNAARLLADQVVPTEAARSFITYEPLGVIFGIMPWNYPFWQVFRFAAPALMAGNTVVFKHAPVTTGCGELLEKTCAEILPPNTVTQVIVDDAGAGKIIDDPRIAAVTLTGSARAGRAVAARAGAALKKCVLELGGSDPWVICADADITLAAQKAVASRLANAGQVCIAAKRMIVVDKVYDAFMAAIKKELMPYTVGDPLSGLTNLGPMARHDLRQEIDRQVSVSKAMGAKCVMGCVIPDGPGFYYPASLVEDVMPGMPLFDEEVFGPVVAIIRASSEDEAIRLANQTEYGLGAVIFTEDLARGEKIAREKLVAGACFVNAAVKSDPRLPFGGIKNSGFGRELGEAGLKEFTNMKTVWVEGVKK